MEHPDQEDPPTELSPNNEEGLDVDSLPNLADQVSEQPREMVEDLGRPVENDNGAMSITTNADNISDEFRDKLEQAFVRYKKPLNVMLVGQAGVGKTSFINSVICATIQQRGYWLNIGAGTRPNVTSVLRRINICVPDEENKHFLEEEEGDTMRMSQELQTKAPRFFDASGLPDENSDVMWMLLRLLLYGHIPIGSNLLDIHATGVQDGAAALQDMFPKCDEELIIDRVVVVCAANVNIPTNLTEAVMNAFQPLSYRQLDGVVSKRTVPVFGLLTKQDLVETDENLTREDYERRKKTLIDQLTLTGREKKLGECQNYRHSEDDAEDIVNDPDIDKSVLKFMSVVCDTSHHIDNPDFRLIAKGWNIWNLFPEKRTLMLIVCLLLILLVIGVFVDHQVAVFIGVLSLVGWVSLSYLAPA